MHSRRLETSIFFAALTLLPCGLLAAGVALPRYDLPVGRKLTYAATSESKSEKAGTFRNDGTLTVTVLRENGDGSRRVALRSATTFTSERGGKTSAQPERVALAYADVFPDGRVLQNPSLGMTIDPAVVLPQLPADAEQLKSGWASHGDAPLPSTYAGQDPPAGDAGVFVFQGEQTGVMKRVYESTSRSTFHFDHEKGVVTRVTAETAQGWGIKMTGGGESRLTSDESIPPADAAALADDFERLFDAQLRHGTAMQDAVRQPGKTDSFIASAKAVLTAALDEAKTDVARGELARMLRAHERSEKHTRQEAERFAKILNNPSPAWTSTDIDGKPAALADYRGKVVVLDFWNRGCGWCIYAMPQVVQLAEDYAGKPVAVIGMNNDQDEVDARFVIDTLGLKYPTVRAGDVIEQYGIIGFPTLVIIDQLGVVRDVHVGYTPTLRASVAKTVDALLGEPAKAGG